MAIIHVATTGNDHHSSPASGSAELPFRTITAACQHAQPGDTVTVHAGVYREWVDLPRGGHNDQQRLTITAATGEHVVISGAEVLDGWHPRADGLWQCRVDDAWFRGTNVLRHELGGDWFYHMQLPQHLGECFCDGHPLVEVADASAVHAREPWPHSADPNLTEWSWCVESAADHVMLVAWFNGLDPREHLIELSCREACIYPRRTGIDWITIRGIECRHAATPWAPPTAEQIGMIGPHWSRGWVIEHCHLHHARCSGISLGAPATFGDNRWTRERVKHGTQREREVVFAALQHGWSRETVGGHIVRHNHIHDCEQTGICGHLGGIWSTISENHIHHIHTRRRFGGHEMAGIKLHAPIDARISDNHIHDCVRGIWLDWQAQGARVHRNLCHANHQDDCYIEVSHGPTVVDHNVFLSGTAVKHCGQGSAFVHNLIAGAVTMQPIPIRYTPYHLPHSTAVMGLMTILGGDDRWLNNWFLPKHMHDRDASDGLGDENADLARGGAISDDLGACPLVDYATWPLPDDDWIPSGGVPAYAEAKLPNWIEGNAYAGACQPLPRETAAVAGTAAPAWSIVVADGRAAVQLSAALPAVPTNTLTSTSLAPAFQPECSFDDPSGQPLDWSRDLNGHCRDSTTRCGPLDTPSTTIGSWPYRIL